MVLRQNGVGVAARTIPTTTRSFASSWTNATWRPSTPSIKSVAIFPILTQCVICCAVHLESCTCLFQRTWVRQTASRSVSGSDQTPSLKLSSLSLHLLTSLKWSSDMFLLTCGVLFQEVVYLRWLEWSARARCDGQHSNQGGHWLEKQIRTNELAIIHFLNQTLLSEILSRFDYFSPEKRNQPSSGVKQRKATLDSSELLHEANSGEPARYGLHATTQPYNDLDLDEDYIENCARNSQHSSSESSSHQESSNSERFRPVLLIIPLRLGLSEINRIYMQALKVNTENDQALLGKQL